MMYPCCNPFYLAKACYYEKKFCFPLIIKIYIQLFYSRDFLNIVVKYTLLSYMQIYNAIWSFSSWSKLTSNLLSIYIYL